MSSNDPYGDGDERPRMVGGSFVRELGEPVGPSREALTRSPAGDGVRVKTALDARMGAPML